MYTVTVQYCPTHSDLRRANGASFSATDCSAIACVSSRAFGLAAEAVFFFCMSVLVPSLPLMHLLRTQPPVREEAPPG